ncbi:hypothetical protein B9T22_002923 [Escherichia coli]|uniref:hypothetical protein n=1 Tax=Escherichia coli TaxID=562 RepID=UPI00183ACA97|nr:hypothetical protein [Escherichia coli]
MSESKCQINGNKIEPCAALAQSLEHDAEYTTRKGLLKYKIYNHELIHSQDLIMLRSGEFSKSPTDAFLAEVKTEARKEGAYFVANRMLAAWEAGFIDDTAKNAADIARMILTSTEFMANAPEGDFDRSFSDGVLEDIAAQLRKGGNQ